MIEPVQSDRADKGLMRWFTGLPVLGKVSVFVVGTMIPLYFGSYQHVCLNDGPWPFDRAWLCKRADVKKADVAVGAGPAGPSPVPSSSTATGGDILVKVQAADGARFQSAVTDGVGKALSSFPRDPVRQVEIVFGNEVPSGNAISVPMTWRLSSKTGRVDCEATFRYFGVTDLVRQVGNKIQRSVELSSSERVVVCG